jgi:uncharacterized protein (TIGR00268 family)
MQTASPPLHDLAPELRGKYDRLLTIFAEMGSVLIGFSGGVDSTLIAKAAYDALGDRALAVTGISPSLMIEEANECPKIAAHIGIPYLEIRTEEMDDPNYTSNPVNRCYFCKSELWDKLTPIARERGYAVVVDGSNVDDLGDFRPGMEAGHERHIRSPLQEAGLTKADIRAVSSALGLPTWNKPSHPCLVAHPTRDLHHHREAGSSRAGGGVPARARLPGLSRPASRRDRPPRTATGGLPEGTGATRRDRRCPQGYRLRLRDARPCRIQERQPQPRRPHEQQCDSRVRQTTGCGR